MSDQTPTGHPSIDHKAPFLSYNEPIDHSLICTVGILHCEHEKSALDYNTAECFDNDDDEAYVFGTR